MDAIYNVEQDTDGEYYHVMSLKAHPNLNLQEFKEYGIIDYVEGTRKKPENPEEYEKLSAEEKAEIAPKVTVNYFKQLQATVKTLQQEVASLRLIVKGGKK